MPKYKNVHELKAALDMDTMVNVATNAQSTRPKSKIIRTCDFCKRQTIWWSMTSATCSTREDVEATIHSPN